MKVYIATYRNYPSQMYPSDLQIVGAYSSRIKAKRALQKVAPLANGNMHNIKECELDAS